MNIPTVQEACAKFLADAQARHLQECGISKYRALFREVEDFAKANGLVLVSEFNPEQACKLQKSWPGDAPSIAQKKLSNLRTFFQFVNDSGWVEQNPTLQLSPKIDRKTFTENQYQEILKACDKHPDYEYLRALVPLLRHSTLSLEDAAVLPRQRINGDKVLLYTAKSGVPVYGLLPPNVLRALKNCPGKRFFFWLGENDEDAWRPIRAAGSLRMHWRRALHQVFTIAQVSGHPQNFRNTFANELLQMGSSSNVVAVLMGNRPRRYAPWTQAELDAAVRRTWVGGGPDHK